MSSFWLIFWVLTGLLFFMIIGFSTFFFYYLRIYRFKIEVFEDLKGQRPERIKVYRMRKVKIPGSVSEEIYFIPKLKSYFSAYGKRMAKNTYWAMRGPDGLLYNFLLKGFDLNNGKYSIQPVHNTVRAFHTTNQKNINERYSKPKNWPVVLMSFTIILSLIIVFAGGWFLFDKINEGIAQTNANIKASQEVTSAAASLVEASEKLVTGGQSPGLRPAPS